MVEGGTNKLPWAKKLPNYFPKPYKDQLVVYRNYRLEQRLKSTQDERPEEGPSLLATSRAGSKLENSQPDLVLNKKKLS